jgi:RNA polymerase sigma-70 factor, ECF subfamily
MLFQSSRRHARVDAAGELVTLEEQDRSAWDGAAIAEAEVLLAEALQRDRVGPYQLQAAIASVHAAAGSADETDWAAIATLYEQLADVLPSPVVELNLAVALAMADGPTVGLAQLDRLGSALDGYYLFHATRADLLRRSGRGAEAAASYRAALELVGTDAERRYLERRLAQTAS